MQERGLRAIFSDKQYGGEELLIKANLPSLYNKRIQDILILLFKVKFTLLPQSIYDLLTLKAPHPIILEKLTLFSVDFRLLPLESTPFATQDLNYMEQPFI